MLNSKPSSTTLLPRPDAPLLTLAALAFLGFADSVYLAAEHYFSIPLPCSLANGCEKVLTSAYSTVGPIPLALFGVAFYLGILALALYLYAAPTFNRTGARLLFAGTVIGLIMSAAFVSIQAFLIHAYCLYCLGSALDTLLLFAAGVWLLRASAKRGDETS